jgi:hypothetical protein
MKGLFPRHIGPAHKWRSRKRQELRNALVLLKITRLGCVYTPTQDRVTKAAKLIEEAIALCSVKKWGR